MQEVEEGDGYSDDDLDALPTDAFQELQENAIRSTQHIRGYGPPGPPQNTSHVSAYTANLTNELSNPVKGISNSEQFDSHGQNDPHQASSDYGDFDSEMLDGEIFDAAEEPVVITGREGGLVGRPMGGSTQREQWRQQRFGPPQPLLHGTRQQQPKGLGVTTENRLEVYKVHGYNHNNLGISLPQEAFPQGLRRGYQEGDFGLAGPQSQGLATMETLQAQVQELLRERNNLQNAVNSASSMAQSKIGEIAIIRANQLKTNSENEQKLLMLQKQHANEIASHKLELEMARAEQKKIATEKGFLEFNLAEGTEKIRNLQRAVKQGRQASTIKKDSHDNPLTPQKSRSVQYGDGFNDDEMQVISPPKLAIRSKPVTPKAGAKRKRKTVDNSPAKPVPLALPLSQPKDIQHHELHSKRSKDTIEAIFGNVGQDNERFRFTQTIINHRRKADQKRSFEELAAFAFPSNPTQSLSTTFLDQLSLLTFQVKVDSFPVALGNIFISLWSQCIGEKYWAPVHLLMDLIRFILLIGPFGIAPYFTDTVVEYAQTTADVNIIPRFQRAKVSELKPEIDTKDCIEILHLMAYGCIHKREEIERFWRCMRFDFAVMMLNIAQPMEELHLAVGLLHTSVLETSFAMRVPPGDGTQGKSQEVVLDRLSRLLVEVPLVAEDAQPYDNIEVADLRLHVLKLMETMCDVKYCDEALATHKDVIGRLVRVMNDELDALYGYHYGHENRSPLVNYATRLLFHLTTTYPSSIDMHSKLRVIPGGTHKYLVALTRLAFSESGFYERGIEEDVAECAHHMLEMLVNPQEAEALLEAFSSARK